MDEKKVKWKRKKSWQKKNGIKEIMKQMSIKK